MGLDMFLYSTGKNFRRVGELAAEWAKEFCDFAHSLCEDERYIRLKGVRRRDLTDKNGTDKKVRTLLAAFKRELLAKAHSLEGIVRPKSLDYAYLVKKDEEDPVTEIGYWRKEWNLHKYIIENFGDLKHDNLVNVYLDEAALNQIIEAYQNDGGYFSDTFRNALAIMKGGGVVFYRVWY